MDPKDLFPFTKHLHSQGPVFSQAPAWSCIKYCSDVKVENEFTGLVCREMI